MVTSTEIFFLPNIALEVQLINFLNLEKKNHFSRYQECTFLLFPLNPTQYQNERW